MAIIIARALKAIPALATVATKRRVPAAADIPVDDTGLALAIIALREVGVFAVGVVDAAHAIGA